MNNELQSVVVTEQKMRWDSATLQYGFFPVTKKVLYRGKPNNTYSWAVVRPTEGNQWVATVWCKTKTDAERLAKAWGLRTFLVGKVQGLLTLCAGA